MRTVPEYIGESKEFIRSFLASDFFMAALIILVGLASFGLGWLSANEAQREPVRIEMSENASAEYPDVTEASMDADTDSYKLVGSRNGTKYHYPWCPGARRIAEKNKVFFDSAEKAAAAGYSAAANCKGLE